MDKNTIVQGAEFCGINIDEFLDMLAAADIPVIHYSPKELRDEAAGLLKKV
jgi:hypothetical protein